MKKTAIAAALTVSIFTLTACNSGDGDSEVVAETSAGDVTKEEFYNEMKSQSGQQVLQQLVTFKVLNDKYDISDEQVDKEVQKTKDQLGDQFEMFLNQQGMSDEQTYRDRIRLSLLHMEAAAEDMDITEEELQKRYDRMQTEIKAQHILVEDKETAKEVKTKLEDDGDFASLAKEYSKDSGSAQNGGDLGYFSSGDMVPAFEDAAYNMEAGDISDPVKSEHGFHIIKVNDKRETEADIGSFEEEKENIRRNIINQRMDPQALQEKVNKMIKEADVNVQAEGLENMFKQQSDGNQDQGQKQEEGQG